MDYVAAVMDLVKALFALGLFVYAERLHRIFRGGIMQGSFRFLMMAPLLFAIAEIIYMLKNIDVVFFGQKLLHDSFEILFIIALFVGFYRLALVWRTKK